MSSARLGKKKDTLRETNNIVKDIASIEPMIQSVTVKAGDLQQAVPVSEISSKYQTLSKQAQEFYQKQKESIDIHQQFLDAANIFSQWLRAARDRLGKISDTTGDKEALSGRMTQLMVRAFEAVCSVGAIVCVNFNVSYAQILQGELPDAQKKLETALRFGEAACLKADELEKEELEEEVALLQEEYDNYTEALAQIKLSLEVSWGGRFQGLINGAYINNTSRFHVQLGIAKWSEFEDYQKRANNWLGEAEKLVQSFNKLKSNLEEKKTVLEQFQVHLEALFDWQRELDELNVKAQVFFPPQCRECRVSEKVRSCDFHHI